MKHKENAVDDFLRMIRQSWTWKRLTEGERNRFIEVLHQVRVSGTYDQRYEQANNFYHAFLYGAGYSPIGWREPEPAASF